MVVVTEKTLKERPQKPKEEYVTNEIHQRGYLLVMKANIIQGVSKKLFDV